MRPAREGRGSENVKTQKRRPSDPTVAFRNKFSLFQFNVCNLYNLTNWIKTCAVRETNINYLLNAATGGGNPIVGLGWVLSMFQWSYRGQTRVQDQAVFVKVQFYKKLSLAAQLLTWNFNHKLFTLMDSLLKIAFLSIQNSINNNLSNKISFW